MEFQKALDILRLPNWQRFSFADRNHPENLVTVVGPLLAKTLTQKTTWIVQINFVVVTLRSWGNTQYVKGDQRICIISIYTIDLYRVFPIKNGMDSIRFQKVTCLTWKKIRCFMVNFI